MPDDLNSPIDPDRITDQKFPTVRRGADPAEVERYLRRVATEMKSLRDREADLRRQLEMIRSAPAPAAPDPIDPSHLTKLLGEETTRVLDAAQAAAAEIRAKAEESVARLLREAREEANEMREEAESLLAMRTEQAEKATVELRERTDAQREAAELEASRIIEESKREGRSLVLEAQQMRKRMLDDLAERREQLRDQIEQLQAGRDRLVAAYDVVRESVSSATAELKGAFPSGAELIEDEDDDLEITGSLTVDIAETGPVASGIDMVDILDAPAPAGTAASESADASKAPSDAGASESVSPIVTREDLAPTEPSGSTPAVKPVVAPTPAVSGPPRSPALPTAQKPDAPKTTAPTTVTSTPTPSAQTPNSGASPAKPETPPADPRPPASSVRVVRTSSGKASDVFARLREEGAEGVAHKSAADAESAPDAEPRPASSKAADAMSKDPKSKDSASKDSKSKDSTSAVSRTAEAKTETQDDAEAAASSIEESIDDDQRLIIRRNEAASSIEASLSRRIKRELSDQQNEMLAALTSVRGNVSTHDVLPMPEDHLERYDDISLAALSEASEAGAALVPARGRGTARSSVADLSAQLASSIVMPLRERLERCVSESSGERDDLAQAIRATFREWKGQRVDDQVSMHVLAACNRGLLDRLPKTMKVHWVVAEGDAPSPDCDDNALAGAIDRGAAFPTGHSVPPMFPGCHCIIAPVED